MYFYSPKARTIVHSYFAYHLHRATGFHLKKVLVGSFIHIYFTCDGILLYGVFSFIFIYMQLKLTPFDIAIYYITINTHCIFNGNVFINLTC